MPDIRLQVFPQPKYIGHDLAVGGESINDLLGDMSPPRDRTRITRSQGSGAPRLFEFDFYEREFERIDVYNVVCDASQAGV
jgi:hypothetical protein